MKFEKIAITGLGEASKKMSEPPKKKQRKIPQPGTTTSNSNQVFLEAFEFLHREAKGILLRRLSSIISCLLGFCIFLFMAAGVSPFVWENVIKHSFMPHPSIVMENSAYRSLLQHTRSPSNFFFLYILQTYWSIWICRILYISHESFPKIAGFAPVCPCCLSDSQIYFSFSTDIWLI